MALLNTHAVVRRDTAAGKIISRLTLEIFEAGRAEAGGWSFRGFQGHPFFRLYYVTGGETRLQFADGDFTLSKGNLCLIPANTPFRYIPVSPLRHLWLHFCSPLMESLPCFQRPAAVSGKAVPGAAGLMALVLRLAGGKGRASDIMRMDTALRTLITPFFERALEDSPRPDISRAGFFHHVIDYIDRGLERELTVPELAALVSMRRNDFSALFHRTFGTAPKQYIVQRRIGRAKILLVSSSLPIKQIAEKTGHPNEFFFYRIFKKHTGLTPGEYRAKGSPCR
jgi:AraC-like DNA-binding protein/mannose-6-phosphate isomerase-like protein (cupin superfamily)